MRRVTLAILAICLVYASVDFFWPLHRDLRQFDPVALGKLETTMWQSYYGRQRVALFAELAEMLRTQYQFPLLRSYLGAYHGASAAFTFKDGKQRSDYEKALPALQAYFGLIRNTGNIDFDAQRAANLELEWWIVHRERARYPPGALGRACAEAAAAVYQVPANSTLKHGQLRAEAMVMRDTRADAGGVTEADWADIASLLRQSYQALRLAVSDTLITPVPDQPLQR
ncbi:hypothetical protein [Polaromonas jejuensis]|uniref:Uncharacterized protein n=1 Tax=Polaromonas jejuensis TaxID=457502 RepID=A0ABW0Q9L8_9BURK|nr:hypothetical protein [Polaromonas jejuensis]